MIEHCPFLEIGATTGDLCWAPIMGIVVIPLSSLFMEWAGLPVERLLAVLVIAVVLVVREILWLWEQYQGQIRDGKVI